MEEISIFGTDKDKTAFNPNTKNLAVHGLSSDVLVPNTYCKASHKSAGHIVSRWLLPLQLLKGGQGEAGG